MSILDDPNLPSRIPPVPRPLTPRARRRSWQELPVRVWVLLTMAMLAATAYITVLRIHQAMADRWLIEHGLLVQANIVSVKDSPTPKRWPRNEPLWATLRIEVPGHASTDVTEWIPAKPDSFLQVGAQLPVRVDPNDPRRWTEQEQARPWPTELIVPAILAPFVVFLGIITALKRRGMLKVWRDGPLVEAVVVETRQSAAAPTSRLVRFSVLNGQESRVFSLLIPARLGIPHAGERIWLICPPQSPARAVAAAIYLESPYPSLTS